MPPSPEQLAAALETALRPSGAPGVLHVVLTAQRDSRRLRVESVMDAVRFRTDVRDDSGPVASFGANQQRAWERAGTSVEYDTASPGHVEHLRTVPGGIACIFGNMTATWEHPRSCVAMFARTIRAGAELPEETAAGVSCRVFYRAAGECKSETGVLVEHRLWLDARTGLPRRMAISQTSCAQGVITNEQEFEVIERLVPGTVVEWRPDGGAASRRGAECAEEGREVC